MSESGVLTEMSKAAEVAEYLRRHPEFFLQHRALLDELVIPHETYGAVSLLQLQQERWREKLHDLEQQQRALLANASRNEHIFRVYGDVYPELFHCTTLRQLWKRLHHTFQERLRIPVSALWLNEGAVQVKRSDKGFVLPGNTFDRLTRQPMAQRTIYLGPLGDSDKQALFGSDAMVHSVALLRLGDNGEAGLLAFGHANPHHYQPGMDCLLLEQLGRFVTLLLPDLVLGRV